MPAQLSFTMCVCEPVAAGRAVRTFGMAEDVTKSKARTALVTGAGRRIGAMIAVALARAALCCPDGGRYLSWPTADSEVVEYCGGT
jgi:hypothetical protein